MSNFAGDMDEPARFRESKYFYDGPKPEITRALYEDRINQIDDTLIGQLMQHFPQNILDRIVSPGFGAFNVGDYERSLGYLAAAITAFPSSEQALFPYLEICHRIVVRPTHADDEQLRRAYEDWLSLSLVKRWNKRMSLKTYAKWFLPKWPSTMRCKYCGRYTRYVNPWESTAGMQQVWGGNFCDHCNRSYPVPSHTWDSIPGQSYIFYRRSVSESVFYRDFLERFAVKEFNDDKFGGHPVV